MTVQLCEEDEIGTFVGKNDLFDKGKNNELMTKELNFDVHIEKVQLSKLMKKISVSRTRVIIDPSNCVGARYQASVRPRRAGGGRRV